MAKWTHPDAIDGGLAYIKANANVMHVIKAYAAADSYATVVGNSCGNASMSSTDYTLGNGSSSSRTLTTASGKTATASASSAQYDGGTATAGASTTLTNSSKSWTTNEHANRAVVITGGTGSGQSRRIASNTGTVLTVDTAWSTTPDNTSTYRIADNLHYAFVVSGTSTVLHVTDEPTDQVITSGNPITFGVTTITASQPT